jgi:ferredoxin
MKKVWITPGCITCGACEFICPEVFEVTDMSHVKPEASLESQSDLIKFAAQSCPVSVIKYQEV